jgi:hypothetical protein
VELRCKIFRASSTGELEQAINRFLAEELPPIGSVQFEEITQSEGPSGVTVVLWYSLTPERADIVDEGDSEYEELDEIGGKELA